MNLRGFAAASAMCLAVISVTSCSDDKTDDVDKAANAEPEKSVDSAASSSPQPDGEQQPNGIAELPPQQILEKAAKALETAPSWHVVTGDGKEKIEFSIDNKENCRGKRTDAGEEMDFIQQGDSLYARPLGTFWKAHFKEKAAQARQLVAGRYIKTSSSDPEFTPLFCSMNMLRLSLFSEESLRTAKLTKGATTTVDGVGTVQLKGTLDGTPVIVTVATTGEPYPMAVDGSTAEEPTRMTFSEFGKAVASDVPAPNEVIDVQELRKAVDIGE